ncbi:MAG: type I-E CRISPR-associated protein Cas5/CasD [Thermodesulfobacteriota bacterium]
MASYLTFQLYGPLQSWGGVAVGEVRPTAAHPSRSGVLGLVAAALGLRRSEEERLAALEAGYEIMVRQDHPGSLLLDYHTVQAARSRRGRVYRCRRDELRDQVDPVDDLATILSRREYLADALFTACMWPRPGNPPAAPWSLDDLAAALARPRFTPYLGRKGCPPGLPFGPRVGEHPDWEAALAAHALDPLARKLWDRTPDSVRVFGDAAVAAGGAGEEFRVRDAVARHGRRQFAQRIEYAHAAAPAAVRQEERHDVPEQAEA